MTSVLSRSHSRRRKRPRWSTPVMLVQAMSPGASNSITSIKLPTSAEPTRIRMS